MSIVKTFRPDVCSLPVCVRILLLLPGSLVVSYHIQFISYHFSCLSRVKLRGGTRGQETERTHLEGWATENFHLPG